MLIAILLGKPQYDPVTRLTRHRPLCNLLYVRENLPPKPLRSMQTDEVCILLGKFSKEIAMFSYFTHDLAIVVVISATFLLRQSVLALPGLRTD